MSKYKRVDTYNKLVRDKIPEIIEADGLIAETRRLGTQEAIKELKKKLLEEVSEFLETKSLDDLVVELADVREVEIALMKRLKISEALVEKVRKDRSQKRGSFDSGIYLIGTKENYDLL